MRDPVRLDGSRGEGGGQILRTALALSVLTGRPFHLVGIRARRPNPGLAPQHLHAVRVMRELSDATCEGDRQGSRELKFSPGPVRSGTYRVEIGTAGSVTLVLQAVALPLALAEGPSEVVLVGGTHVPWSPPFNYVESCWGPFMTRIGLDLDLRLEAAGFYPKGGGRVVARFPGGAKPSGLRLQDRGELRAVEVVSASARLPSHVVHRQAGRARAGVQHAGVAPSVRLIDLKASSPGSVVAVTGIFENTRVTAAALGARGKPAEAVGEEAASSFRFYLENPGAVDQHLADQLVLPLAFAQEASDLTTVRVTEHLKTNVEVIRAFLDRPVVLDGDVGAPGRIHLL